MILERLGLLNDNGESEEPPSAAGEFDPHPGDETLMGTMLYLHNEALDACACTDISPCPA